MTAVERKVRGKARPASDMLSRYREDCSRVRANLAAKGMQALMPLLVPDEASVIRYRVEYACGCVEEVLATSAPDDVARPCPGDHWTAETAPGRAVTEWLGEPTTRTFAPDPDSWNEYIPPGPEREAMRRREIEQGERTILFHPVRLSCGHDEQWLRRVGERERYDLPAAASCNDCLFRQPVVAYQRIGPLVPPVKPTPPNDPAAKRRAAERRLARLETETARLRAELEEDA